MLLAFIYSIIVIIVLGFLYKIFLLEICFKNNLKRQ